MRVVAYADRPGRFAGLTPVLSQAGLRVLADVHDPGSLARAVRDQQPEGVVAAIDQPPLDRSLDRLEWVLALMPCLLLTGGPAHAALPRGALPRGAVHLALPATAYQLRCAAGDLKNLVVRPALTATEAQIMNLVAAGYRNHDIAKELGISLGTVKNRLFSAYCRLQAPNRAAAVTAWLRTAPPVRD